MADWLIYQHPDPHARMEERMLQAYHVYAIARGAYPTVFRVAPGSEVCGLVLQAEGPPRVRCCGCPVVVDPGVARGHVWVRKETA